MTSATAKRSDWKTVSSSGAFAVLSYTDLFSLAEYEVLQRGLVPGSMDDKWFIYYEAPTLFLHRSWTGELIFRVTLQPREGGAVVAVAEVTTKYETDSMQARLLPWVIRGLLLEQDFPFPGP